MADNRKNLIFGLEINSDKKQKEEKNASSFGVPSADDGSLQIPTAGYGAGPLSQSYVIALDAGVASEAELIERYRTMALYPQADLAIQEIVSDAIVQDDDQPVVDIDLDDVPKEVVGKATQKKIHEGFKHVLKILDFDRRGDQIFQRWYIDSRIIYHKIVDGSRVREGVKEVRQIDPRKMKLVKEIKAENTANGVAVYTVTNQYYVYIESATTYNKSFGGQSFGQAVYNQGATPSFGTGSVRVSVDSIAFIHSGLVDPSSGVIYGHLQKAIKPFNTLRMLEDSVLIYRLARASERRIFYVDTGNLPVGKADFYVNQLKNRFRNKISYDAQTGEISDKRRVMSLQEDLWLPRMAGSKGTEVDTLPGAQNLGVMDDVEHFKSNLWDSLNVPSSRFKSDGASAFMGVGSEITREELKFAKFVDKLRAQFAALFADILKTHLILTKVLTEDEWDQIEQFVKFVWARDSHWAEMRDAEILQRRLSNLALIDPYVGRYFTRKYVQKKVLQFTDEDIDEMKEDLEKEAEEEKKNPRLTNPVMAQNAQMLGLQPPEPPPFQAGGEGADPREMPEPPQDDEGEDD
jgi:hypothetical protein